MAFQASSRHKLVDEHPVFIFTAVSNEFNEVGVPQLPEEDDLRLESHTQSKGIRKQRNPIQASLTRVIVLVLTSHSLWPCDPSKSRDFTATYCALSPGRSFSSMYPL